MKDDIYNYIFDGPFQDYCKKFIDYDEVSVSKYVSLFVTVCTFSKSSNSIYSLHKQLYTLIQECVTLYHIVSFASHKHLSTDCFYNTISIQCIANNINILIYLLMNVKLQTQPSS